jgi:hypothetical protein
MDSDQDNNMTVPAPQQPLNENAFQPQPEQLVNVPSYSSQPLEGEPVLHQEVPSYQAPEINPPPPKKSNKTVWIIIAIILALICCCCIVAVVMVYRSVGSLDPQDWQDMLDQYSRLTQILPAFL